jgi:dipeptidyl aminopeptidase/acylaminoacyl peptidase
MSTNNRITPEKLLELNSVVNPQFSPDGKSFVYVQTTINKDKDEYESHIFYHTLENSGEPVQWTYGNSRNHTPRWSPDGSSLAFVSNRSGKNQIYLLNISGGEARQLTNLPSGAGNPVWSPDGSRIAFNTSLKPGKTVFDMEEEKIEKLVPLEVIQMKYKSDGSGFLQGDLSQVAVVSIKNGELTQLTNSNYDVNLYSWSPDGKFLAIGADTGEDKDLSFTHDVYLLQVETKALTPVTNGTGYFGDAVWSPDGNFLGMIGHEREYENATHPNIWLYNFASNQLSCITKHLDIPIGDILIGDFHQGAALPGLVWTNDSKGYYFIATEHGNTNIYYGNIAGEVTTTFEGEQYVYGLSIHEASQQVIAAISTPTDIGDLYLLSLSDGNKLERLTDANAAVLDDIVLSKPESFEFEGSKGWSVQGWIIKPIGFEKGKKYPLILEIHGGPHAMYGNSFMNEFQILAAKGYAVMYINPRGSHGYSQEFVDAVRGDYGGGDYQDLMQAVDYCLNQYDFIDQTRLGVTGGSYGGFMTNWIVGHTNRFKAAVTQRSISNWISFYGVSDIGYYFTEWQIGTDLSDIQTLWKHSPLAYVKNVETPLLILHSEKDYRCPIEQGEQLFIALKRLGKETKFVRFPEENHELSRSGRPSLRINRLEQIVNWFSEYI